MGSAQAGQMDGNFSRESALIFGGAHFTSHCCTLRGYLCYRDWLEFASERRCTRARDYK